MLLVIADTSPVRYLIQIDHIDLLPRLFGTVIVPSVVVTELLYPSAPAAVRAWMTKTPDWLKAMPAPDFDDRALMALDPGERSAITLGLALKADLILMDDRKGAAVALGQRFGVYRHARRSRPRRPAGSDRFGDRAGRASSTNFRYRPELFTALVRKHTGEANQRD